MTDPDQPAGTSWRSLIPLISVLAFTPCAFPQFTETGKPALRVHVSDPDKLPVTGARVTLRAAIGGPFVEAALDAEGIAKFHPAATGRFLVNVQAEGFTETARFVDWQDSSQTVEIGLDVGGLRQQVTITSGSRVDELQQDSPIEVEAVTRQAMINTGYERLSDVLGEIPGVVTRNGSSGTVSAEQIRGISARQVAVLQDGLPMVGARVIKSGNLNLNRQSTARLDRVEVVKGAASALFGSDAIGGVINMISREPTEKMQANLNFSGGSLGAFDGRGDILTRYKNLSLFLDLEHHRQDSYAQSDRICAATISSSKRVIRSHRQSHLASRPTPTTIGRKAETPVRPGQSADCITTASRTTRLVADLLPTSHTALQLRAYSARYDENSRVDPLGVPGPSTLANLNQRYKGPDGTLSHQFGSRNLIQGGYEWVQDNYRGANRLVGDNAGRQITSNDVWLQAKFQLTRFARGGSGPVSASSATMCAI